MNRSDTAKLLAFCAAYDQRTIGEADVLAWYEAIESPWVPNIDLDEAKAAVTSHYRETPQRITVADVLKRVKTDRADRLGRGIPVKKTGVPATEEYHRIRAEWEASEHPNRAHPEGAA